MKALRPSLFKFLDTRREYRVVRRRKRQLVDDHQRERFAAHIDAFPETLAADQDGVAQARKRSSNSFLLRSPCNSKADRVRRAASHSLSNSCVRRIARSEVHRKKARPALALSTGNAALTTASA
jgi:UDP-N-acetylglucosamine transferase subunit ALG13